MEEAGERRDQAVQSTASRALSPVAVCTAIRLYRLKLYSAVDLRMRRGFCGAHVNHALAEK